MAEKEQAGRRIRCAKSPKFFSISGGMDILPPRALAQGLGCQPVGNKVEWKGSFPGDFGQKDAYRVSDGQSHTGKDIRRLLFHIFADACANDRIDCHNGISQRGKH
jgi:hypothetical protein